MTLRYQKRKSLGGGRTLNVSKRGMSVSQRVGPLTLNSRGRGSLRIAPGLSYRFGSRKKSDPTGAVIMLAIALCVVAVQIVVALLVFAVTVVSLVLIWLGRWLWFSAVALVARIRGRELPAAPVGARELEVAPGAPEPDEAARLFSEIQPYIEGTHKGDKVELDEDVARKIIRWQELTGVVVIDAKAAQAALAAS